MQKVGRVQERGGEGGTMQTVCTNPGMTIKYRNPDKQVPRSKRSSLSYQAHDGPT